MMQLFGNIKPLPGEASRILSLVSKSPKSSEVLLNVLNKTRVLTTYLVYIV